MTQHNKLHKQMILCFRDTNMNYWLNI